MRYLLDTHALIWYGEHDQQVKLPQKVKDIIDDPENIIHVSVVSLWEIAIKVSLGKLNLSFKELLT